VNGHVHHLVNVSAHGDPGGRVQMRSFILAQALSSVAPLCRDVTDLFTPRLPFDRSTNWRLAAITVPPMPRQVYEALRGLRGKIGAFGDRFTPSVRDFVASRD
jgi:hypothetical protein